MKDQKLYDKLRNEHGRSGIQMYDDQMKGKKATDAAPKPKKKAKEA